MSEAAGPAGGRAAALVAQMSLSDRLRSRRLQLLPVDVDDQAAPTTAVQARGPGDSTAPADLVELITSIASVGVLQPVLVEERPDGTRHLVAGERRYRAVRWGRAHLAGNPHFDTLPAVVCDGPLTATERATWQLIENLARDDLQPGDMAAALMLERSAVLAAKLTAHRVDVTSAMATDDPTERFRQLDRLRRQAELHTVGAPWDEVLGRLGLQLRVDKARQLVRAFALLPPELSCDMDEHKVALATRLEFCRLLRQGRDAAAAGIWAAVKQRARPAGLLTGAVRAAIADPELDADSAADVAEACHADANEARRLSLSQPTAAPSAGVDDRAVERVVSADLVGVVITGLRSLVGELRGGARASRFDTGSLRLLAGELTGLLDALEEAA